MSYYSLLQISEVAQSAHTLQARDVHIASNKNKILIYLYSSKMHAQDAMPQKDKISGATRNLSTNMVIEPPKHFCPFGLIRQYIALR